MAFEIEINKKWCKKCSLCVEFCPKNVYDQDPLGAPIPIRIENCIGCHQCEYRCPDFSITISPK